MSKNKTTDHSRTDRDKRFVRSRSALYFFGLSHKQLSKTQMKEKEQLEADANSKHHNAEAGKRAAKLLKVALIKASCS